MRNGQHVAEFEKEFASYVGAKYAIALANGTCTLHTALAALGVTAGDRVAVPCLTMSATTIAVLHAGAVPAFCDVDPDTWLSVGKLEGHGIHVSLYGLHHPDGWPGWIDDAAQTLRPHDPDNSFTSYSFQASKILALGEGGMLVTDSEELATRAREFSSLGYRMNANQPRIDPATLKSPDYARHYSLGFNYRMSDLVAERALYDADYGWKRDFAKHCDELKQVRQDCAAMYAEAIEGCEWLTPQHVPEGWSHDYWAYTVKVEDHMPHIQFTGLKHSIPCRWNTLAHLIEYRGGERPYAAWRLTYDEPALQHLCPPELRLRHVRRGKFGPCPVAEDLQPRLLQFQTNDIGSARRNAAALKKAICQIG
jgi:perosamine synthetase